MRPIQVATPHEPMYGQVMPGDTVMVQTPDRKPWRFVVERIDGDTIIAYLVAGIVGGVFVMIGIATASALDSFWEHRAARGQSRHA